MTGADMNAVERLGVFVLGAVIAVTVASPGVATDPTARVAWLAALLVATPAAAHAASRWRTAVWLRHGLPAVVLISVYEAIGAVIDGLGVPPRESWVIGLEQAITGGRLPPLSPFALPVAMVDALSLAYAAYFVLPIVLIVVLHRRGDRDAAAHATLTLLAAFYLHYAIYIVVPVVGPIRSPEVPPEVRTALASAGGAVTHWVRHGVSALEGATQDGFPSAHTSVACLVAALARAYRVRGRSIFVGIAAAIIASTILLGYHYIVDVLAAGPVGWIAWRATRGVEYRRSGLDRLRLRRGREFQDLIPDQPADPIDLVV
jgi:membrane-associated phospholipid phosphatase